MPKAHRFCPGECHDETGKHIYEQIALATSLNAPYICGGQGGGGG